MKTYRYKNFAYRFYQGRLYRMDLVSRKDRVACDGCACAGKPRLCLGIDGGCMTSLCTRSESRWQDITDVTKKNLGVRG